jgi:O-antigen ligase
MGLKLALPFFIIIFIGTFFLLFIKQYKISYSILSNKILFFYIWIFFIWQLFECLRAFDIFLGAREIIRLIFGIITFFIIYLCFPKDKKFLSHFLTVVIWASSILMGFLIYKYLFIFKSPFLGSELNYQTRESRNQLTQYFLYIFPYLFFYTFYIRKRIYKIIPFVLILFGLIYSGSRGTIIALVIGFLITFIIAIYNKIRILSIFKVIAGVILCASIFLFMIRPIERVILNKELEVFDRFYALYRPDAVANIGTYDLRSELIKTAWDDFQKDPILGIGSANFIFMNNGDRLPTHNDYLAIAVEDGLVGLILFLIILGIIYKRILTAKIKPRGNDQHYYLGMLWSFNSIIIFLNFMNCYPTVLFWMNLGLSLVILEILHRDQNVAVAYSP